MVLILIQLILVFMNTYNSKQIGIYKGSEKASIIWRRMTPAMITQKNMQEEDMSSKMSPSPFGVKACPIDNGAVIPCE